MWPEVQQAKCENRHEIILAGKEIAERIDKEGLDPAVFTIKSLNYLNIHETSLKELGDDVAKLCNLQTLVLHSNQLHRLTQNVAHLEKLKVIDISRNCLQHLPNEFASLINVTSMNLSSNQLEDFPSLKESSKLQVLDLSNNQLKTFPDICNENLTILSDLKLNGNEIEEIPADIVKLGALKNFDISKNKIKQLPGELSDLHKLKELNLKENPITDRRLFKLIEQCRTKQVLDYVKQHCRGDTSKSGKKSKKGGKVDSLNSKEAENDCLKIHIKHYQDDTTQIIIKDDVKAVRAFILGCIVHDIKFTDETFKKFIQIQTKLHDGVCEKRNAATIATHDAAKVIGNLTYTALSPKELMIQPLNRLTNVNGEQLFTQLQTEAENLRKEKKRNVYTGIYKYLYLLEGQKYYPCIMHADNTVISFPPITNSEITKISCDSSRILLEVTSSTSQTVCKKVLDALLVEIVQLFNTDIVVEQIKCTDIVGNLKSVYPSKADLLLEDGVKIQVIRD